MPGLLPLPQDGTQLEFETDRASFEYEYSG